MSHSTSSSWKRNAVITLATSAGVILGIAWIHQLIRLDPLARLKGEAEGSLSESIGMRFEDVKLTHYRKGDIMSAAHVDRVDVSRDRSRFYLYNITDGTYHASEGKVDFTAPEAQWQASRKVLVVTKGAHIKHKDFELDVPDFRMSELRNTLFVPGQISGRLYDGQVKTAGLLYSFKDRSVELDGPTHWEGKLALALDQNQQTPAKPWTFQNDGKVIVKNGIRTFQNATASDGEVIVKADVVSHNTRNDVVTATGNVRYFGPESNMVCKEAVIFRRERRAVFTKDVDMLIKAKDQQTKAEVVEIPPFKPMVPDEVLKSRPQASNQRSAQDKQLDQDTQDPKSLRKYPLTVTAQRIEYWYARGSRRAVITGNPQARQEMPGGRWRHVWTHTARFDGEADRLRLVSSDGKRETRVLNSLGDDFTALWAEFSIDENVEDFEGEGVQGTFVGSPDDETTPPPTGGGGGGGTTGGSGLSGPIGDPSRRRV